MTKTKIVLSLLGLAAAVIPFGYYVSFVGSTEELIKRYPDIDPNVVYKVHKEIFWETLQGKHGDIIDADDADGSTGELDKLFYDKAKKYTS